MSLNDIMVYTVVGVFAVWILFRTGILGAKRGKKRTVRERDTERTRLRKMRFSKWMFGVFTYIAGLVGKGIPESKLFEMQYKLDRCEIRSKNLERGIKAVEVYGIFRAIQLFFILLTLIIFSITLNLLSLLLLLGCLIPKAFILFLNTSIAVEDEELEANFPDLYLLLYSRLLKGANANIDPTIRDYIASLDDIYGVGVGHKAIRKFCNRFSANVEIYGDESIAVRKLRDYYHSPTVINFCNLAAQSLSGVDNADKLLSFKQELSEARKRAMELAAERLVKKGNRTVYLVYIILFEFIILSWVSKIDLSLISMMF